MIEKLFLNVENGKEKVAIADAIACSILEDKKIDIYKDDDTDIPFASFTKYEVLRDGISFELDEPVPDYEVRRHNLMDHVTLDKPKLDKDKNVMTTKIKRFVA